MSDVRKPREESFMFWIVLAVIGACCLAIAPFKARGQEPTNLEPYKAVCQIHVPGAQGSGCVVAVRPDLNVALVLTARHVAVSPGQPCECEWLWADVPQTTKGVTLGIVKGSKFDTDMAIIGTEIPKGVNPLPVAVFRDYEGPWIAAGFRGSVMRVSGPESQANYSPTGLIAFETVFVHGQSGGPLFNRYGQVVGVIVATDEKTTSICSDGDNLQKLIKAFVTDENPLRQKSSKP